MMKHKKPFLCIGGRSYNASLVFGFLIILSIVLVAVFADVIAPYDFDQANMDARLQKPGGAHIFGTDEYGRDVFSRTVYGCRITLSVALVAVALQLIVGTLAGLLAGFFGRFVDRIISFITDFTWSIPALILAFAVVMVLGKGLVNTIIAIAIVSWAQYARVVRAKTMSIKNMPFIETGVAFGESKPALLFRYILPNVLPAIIVMASISIPTTIVSATSLSFLGLGAQSPSPDWGLTLSNSMTYIDRAPWISIFPGLALVYTTFGFSIFGEGLRDMLDPRLKV